MNHTIELIILDCDGVLIDSEPLSALASAMATERCGNPLHPMTAEDAMTHFTGLDSKAIRRVLREVYGIEDVEAWSACKREILAGLFREKLQTVPRVKETLDRLEAAGMPFCVASNSPRKRLALAFSCVGFETRFGRAVFSAQDVACGKPAPDLHLHAAASMGVHPEACLVIDDSPAGILGAKAAGMTAWGFAGTCEPFGKERWIDGLIRAGADRIVDRFDALLEVLESNAQLALAGTPAHGLGMTGRLAPQLAPAL